MPKFNVKLRSNGEVIAIRENVDGFGKACSIGRDMIKSKQYANYPNLTFRVDDIPLHRETKQPAKILGTDGG